MNEREAIALDAAVRNALDSGPAAARRVARGALAASPRRSRLAPLAGLAAAATVLVWAVRPAAPPPAPAPGGAPALRIVNHGRLVGTFHARGGSLADATPPTRPAPRFVLIVHGGDS